MDSLIETFHIDWKLLLAQIVNFGIAFSVLYFFALKPLGKAMSQRTKMIEKSVQDSKEIEKKLGQTEQDYKAEIARAKKEANEILEKAARSAEIQKNEMLVKAKEEITQAIGREKEKLEAEKIKTVNEIKAEIADLVSASVGKILEER